MSRQIICLGDNIRNMKSMLNEYFDKFLLSVRKVSPCSVQHYGNALRTISRYLIKLGKVKETIFEVDSISELLSLRELLKTIPEFVALDTKGNRMYTAGLNRYIEFASADSFFSTPDEIAKLDSPMHVEPKEKIRKTTLAYSRDRIIIHQALVSVQYCCEIDKKHKTFIAEATNENFLEGHHIIPMRLQKKFAYSLDVYANILGVCPNCHRLLHYGRLSDRRYVLSSIFEARAERLNHSGINLGRDDFFSLVESVNEYEGFRQDA